MSAYAIGHITVKDIDKWAEYRGQVPSTLEPWGAKVIFGGQRSGVLTGEHRHADTVVIQFPDQDALRAWYDSEAYQALISLRNEAAEMVLVSYEGWVSYGAGGRLKANQADNPSFSRLYAITPPRKPQKTGITLSIL